MKKLVLAIVALVALPFEIYQALHHLHAKQIEYSVAYFIGAGLTLIACCLASREIWHHFKNLKEPSSREILSVGLILAGVCALFVAIIGFLATVFIAHTLAAWTFWCAVGGVASIAVGAMVDVPYVAPQLTLFDYARDEDARIEQERKWKEADAKEAEAEQYYREHPEKRPTGIPPVPPSMTKYVS